MGNSLALMLAAHQDLRIGVVEANPYQAISDNRSIVLSYTSHLILKTLDVWQKLASTAYPIKKIHVSQRGHFGAARFDAAQHDLEAFGYIVPAEILTQSLREAVVDKKNIVLIAPAEVQALSIVENNSQVTLQTIDGMQNFTADLIIAADGSHSKIRNLQNITVKTYDYQQTAIITNVEISADHQQTAYERLTNSGPLALLPREPHCCGVVWTVRNDEMNELLNLTDKDFLARLQQRFGYRLGAFINIQARKSYPLQLIHAEQQVQPGLVLVGNAAHTLHPLAGQGFNLALRNIAALAEILLGAKKFGRLLGDLEILQKYERWRRQDQMNIVGFTDRTVRLFSNDVFPLPMARSLGLLTIDSLPMIKRNLVRRMLGLSGKTPRMVCGIENNYE